MYRFSMRLKGYVCTNSHPEGSIAESYVFDECVTFCSRYLQDCETRFSRLNANELAGPSSTPSTMPFFDNTGRPLAGKHDVTLDNKTWLQAHRYVLFNYDHIEPYLRSVMSYVKHFFHRVNFFPTLLKFDLTIAESMLSFCPQLVIEILVASSMKNSMSGLDYMWQS